MSANGISLSLYFSQKAYRSRWENLQAFFDTGVEIRQIYDSLEFDLIFCLECTSNPMLDLIIHLWMSQKIVRQGGQSACSRFASGNTKQELVHGGNPEVNRIVHEQCRVLQ